MLRKIKRQIGTWKRVAFGWLHHHLDDCTLPEGIKVFSIGNSVQGRPIEVCRIGRGEKRVAFVGAIHGNEVGTYRFVRRLLRYLALRGKSFKGFTFFFIPCLNPDGYTLASGQPDFGGGGRIGRFNGNGVDLNRNFPVKSWQQVGVWSHGDNYSHTTEVFAGESAGSEPEVKVLTSFLVDQRVDLLFMFHNCGGDVVGSKEPRGQEMARHFHKATGFKLYTEKMWKDLGQLGSCKEWCEGAGISMLEVEGSYRWGSDWRRQKKGVVACLQNLL